MGSSWYYLSNSTRIGPVEGSEIARLILEGSVTTHTLVWRQGLDGWEEAGNHFKFSENLSSPPPVPPHSFGAARVSDARVGNERADSIVANRLYFASPARSFGEAISVCFSKYVTFSGRASRSEYWFFALFCLLLGLAATVVDAAVFSVSDDLSPVNALTSLALFLPSLAVGVRRLHDINRSGWWIGGFWILIIFYIVIISFISNLNPYAFDVVGGLTVAFGIVFLIYIVAMFVFCCQRGNTGPNRFG